MFTSRARRIAVIGSCLALVAVMIGGCLECQESILGRYDADKDQFVFLNVYQRIGGERADDFDYLEKLWKNRDHLITPPIPNILGKTSFLRLSNKEVAVLNLGSESRPAVESSPLPLDQITILPGKFFLRGDSLCYFDQIVVPGTFADATLKVLNQQGREEIDKEAAAERDRRAKGGKHVSWDELRKSVMKDLAKDAAPATSQPAGQAEEHLDPDLRYVLSDSSLEKITKGLADGSIGLTREKAIFRLTIRLDEQDAKEAMTTIAEMRTALAEALKKPDHVKDVDDEASIAEAIEATSPQPGVVVLSVDATELFPRVEALFKPVAELPAPQGDEAKHAADALAAIKAKNIPIDETMTVKQIVTDFHEGKLKGYPPEKSVPAGEGLVVGK